MSKKDVKLMERWIAGKDWCGVWSWTRGVFRISPRSVRFAKDETCETFGDAQLRKVQVMLGYRTVLSSRHALFATEQEAKEWIRQRLVAAVEMERNRLRRAEAELETWDTLHKRGPYNLDDGED